MGNWLLKVVHRFYWTGYRNMKIRVVRVDDNDLGLFGKLSIDGEKFQCVTLERHDVAIPVGTYKVTLYNSPRWKCKVPLLHDVPRRSMIEIHWGNYPKDTEGCILVGSKRVEGAIEYSRKAFDGLMEVLGKANDLSIEVS